MQASTNITVCVAWRAASRCLAKVLAPSSADDLFAVIVDTRTCKLETKHSPASFVAAMDAAGVPADVREGGASACVLLDDSVTNIKTAKQMGWTTVLVRLYLASQLVCPSDSCASSHGV